MGHHAQVGEEHSKHQYVGDQRSGFDFLQRDAGPGYAKIVRQRLVGDCLHGCNRLSGTDPIRQLPADRRSFKQIVTLDRFRPERRLPADQHPQRKGIAIRILDVDVLYILKRMAVIGVRRNHHPVNAAILDEVVDVKRAQVRLQRCEDITDVDTQRFRTIAVDRKKVLWRICGKAAVNLAEFGLTVQGSQKGVLRSLQRVDIITGIVEQLC